MNTQRLLIAVLWLASLTAAFFIGNSLGGGDHTALAAKAGQSAGASGTLTADEAAKAEADRKVARQFGEADEVGPDGKRKVSSVIKNARLAISGGMGGFMNMRAMMRAFAPLAELDDAQIAEALGEVERTVVEPQGRMMFYSMLLSQWAEKDGQAALNYAREKIGNNKMFGMGIEAAVLGSWARSNPEGAWKWFQSEQGKDDDRSRGMGANMLFAGLAASNLDSALARLETLDEQTKPMALMGIAASASGEQGRTRLLERAASLPPESRGQIYNSVVGQWAMSDPDNAVKWIRALPADQQPAVRESAGQMLLMSRPDMAADLMLEKAKPEDKSRLYDTVAGRWAFQDPKAAGEWLTKQPQGPELDAARRSYATAVSQRDPAGAMAWATSVQDPEQRAQSVQQTYQMWRQRDAAAAEAGLKGSGLPAEKIQEILTAPGPAKALPAPTRAIGF